jgi:hypothetical protein
MCSASPIITDGTCCNVCDDLIITPVRVLMSAYPTTLEIVSVFRNAVRTHKIITDERRKHAEASKAQPSRKNKSARH